MTLPPPDARTGLAFHRLIFARRRTGWWTPLAVLGLGGAFYFAMLLILMVGLVVYSLNDPTLLEKMAALAQNPSFDLTDPVLVAVMLGSIAILLPSYVLASLIVNGGRLGLISSAAGRLRWGWMLACTLVALVWAAIITALSMLLPAGDATTPPGENPQWIAALVVLLLLVPVQAAAEEYVFRGYLMQSIGRWLRHPAWAILLPVPLFVFGHLYDAIGLTAVGVFAVAAGWLTWRTGGLEAAIALHVVNNLTSFLIQLAGGADASASDQSILSLVFAIVLVGGYVAIVEWILRRRAQQGKPLPSTLVLTPPVAPPPVMPAPQWAPPQWQAGPPPTP